MFQAGLTVTDDIKDFLSFFDTKKDGTIDEKEIVTLKKVLNDYAGKDKVLDKNELLQIFGLTPQSKNADKIVEQFQSIVQRAATGSSQTTTTTENGETITNSFNADGSGTRVVIGKDKDGKEIKQTYTFGKGHLLEKMVRQNATGTLTNDYTYGENKKPSIINQTLQDPKGKITSTIVQKLEYNENNELITRSSEQKDSSGKTIMNQKNEYVNGKLSKATKNEIDKAGKKSQTVQTYEADGKTLKTLDKTYYRRGAIYKDHYEGANLKNRLGYLPSERIAYENDGKTIKQVIKNQFNENGILIGREEYNKDGKLVDKKDFSKVDGHFDTSYQGGRGDCYLLAAINSLSETEAGEKLLQQNVKKNNDGSYTITFPGVSTARKTLISGEGGAKIPTEDGKNLDKLPEDKVYLTGNYTITAEELEKASKLAGKRYSSGDKDVLLLELAYEKYRGEVMDTIKDNNIKQKDTLFIAGLDMGLEPYTDRGDYLSSGKGESALFIITGKQAESFNGNNKNAPTCYVDSEFNMHLPDENNTVNAKAMYTSINGVGRRDNLDKLLNKLRTDSKDGKVDNYAAIAGMKVSSQEVNGKIIGGGGHALNILKVTDKTVTLSNPWSPEDTFEMPISDFKKAAYHLSLTQIDNKPVQSSQSNTSQGIHTTPPNGQQAQANNDKPTNNTNKPNYTVPKGMGYTAIIKNALIKQGIDPTKENIQKAKAQFEQANPDAVQTYNGKKQAWKGNKFLYVNAQVFIPNFKM